MMKPAQVAALVISSLFLLPTCAQAQAAPAGVGPQIFQNFGVPTVAGTLHYSLHASERLMYGYNGNPGTVSQASLFGDLGYLSSSETDPFSALYSGGYLWVSNGAPSGFFHNLSVTQTVSRKRWSLLAADDVHYLPQAPTTGLSGLLGLGSPGFPTSGGGLTSQGILTNYAPRVQNDANGQLTVPLTGNTSLIGNGSYLIMRFPDSTGIESDLYSAGGGINHRFGSRNNLLFDYDYTHFQFKGVQGAFVTHDFLAGYSRHWSRKFVTDFRGGPQLVDFSQFAGGGTSLNYTADLQADYILPQTTYLAGYIRKTNSGYGVTYGSRNDTVRLGANHRLTPQLDGALTGTYSHDDRLKILSTQSFTSTSYIATVQLNRTFTERISAYASYSAAHQSVSGAAAGIAPFNGLLQIVGFGASYSPRPTHVGHH